MAITFGNEVRQVEGNEGNIFTVETPRELVPRLVGYTPGAVAQGLRDAAARAGITDFDYGPAIEAAAAEHPGTGWMTGAGPLQIVNAILSKSGVPGLNAQRNDNPDAVASDARYGVIQENTLRPQETSFFGEAVSFLKEALTSPPALVFYALAGANAAGLIGSASAETVIPAAAEAGGAFGATEGLGMAGSFESLSAGYVPLTGAGASILTQAATSAATTATTTAATQGAASAAGSAAGGAGAGTVAGALATGAAAIGNAVLSGVANAIGATDQPTYAPSVIGPPPAPASRTWLIGLGLAAGVGTVAYVASRKKK